MWYPRVISSLQFLSAPAWARFGKRHAAGDEPLGAHVEVERQLVVHGVDDLRPTKDKPDGAAHR